MQVCQADPKWPQSSVIELDMEDNLNVWGDEKQLFTVFSHIIHNGITFCQPGNERLKITAINRLGPTRQQMTCLSVQDNGPGIQLENNLQIFEPFFTTRTDGTGLGLAIVKQTIEAHNGYIVVGKSKELGGASFSIFLPLKADAKTGTPQD